MDDKLLEGTISFVQYDKKYVSIEYLHNGKLKTINGSIKETSSIKEGKATNKPHHFREGDAVSFVLTRSARGDKMVADQIQYRFNNSLSTLLHKATTENKFMGYLKKVDEGYFIKETGSYHFFPLKRSPWEKEFSPNELNEPVFFILENFSNPDKATALLLSRQFIPEYKKAQHYFENKTWIDARVFKITPHGIYLDVIGNKIQAKLPLPAGKTELKEQPGDTIKITITYLGPEKIVVKRAE
jgi:ribosomal protein S1